MRDALPPNMQAVSEAAARLRHRQWHWCRRPNGFSDKPLWRVVAGKADVPLCTVLAFVNRLEERANDAANAGHSRGYVGDFSAAEFGFALDIAADHAARILAVLVETGWVSYDHVADFYDRNKDVEDETATERKRRQRTRERAMKDIGRRYHAGEISIEERGVLEAALLLDDRLARKLSTGHIVTPRDIVTVTADQSTDTDLPIVDKSEGGARGEAEAAANKAGSSSADLSTRHDVTAEQWISSAGKLLLIERMQIQPLLAETYLARWQRDLPHADALKSIIEGADQAGYVGARFHTIITDQLRRYRQVTGNGPQLPLGPAVLPGLKKAGHG